MPVSNRIWTIKDVSGDIPEEYNEEPFVPSAFADDEALESLASAQSSSSSPIKLCHIPTLPNADAAKALLQRVFQEFEPIIQQRKYNVRSVSELCCCGDGLDHQPGRSKKLRKQNNYTWGYNQTTFFGGGRKSHTIHLRLRHPARHDAFLLYEDVAGTMAHELAHCVFGEHDERFFKLMDEILEQHALIMASKLTRNNMPMLAFGGDGRALGGGAVSLADSRNQQQQQQQPFGHVLGGDAAFKEWMTPMEAAVVAAEARRRQTQLRLRGDRCCRPCLDQENDEDDVQVLDDDRKPAAKPYRDATTGRSGDKKRANGAGSLADIENWLPRPKKGVAEKGNNSSTTGKTMQLIDLTNDDDDLPVQTNVATMSWPCGKCTFLNQHVAHACAMCLTQRDL
jgi:hypothetical protein